MLRLFDRLRHDEAAAGVGPKPHRLRFTSLGATDVNSPLLQHLVPADILAAVRAGAAAVQAAAESDAPLDLPGVTGQPAAAAAGDAEDAAPADEDVADEVAEAKEGGEPAARAPQPPPGPLRILEGLAASGLRSFRYAQEVPNVGVVVANDMDPVAAAAIRRNKAFGGDAVASVVAHQQDARLVMLTHEKLFDVVDLDPYGTPVQLLDAAVQAVAEGGMLCVTATDMAVLCGNASEVCWTKYGSYPVKNKACHEVAIRTLLAAIQGAAARHRRHIVPLLSVSIDFYVRCVGPHALATTAHARVRGPDCAGLAPKCSVFVRLFTSASAVKASASKHAYVFQCVNCESLTLQPLGRIVEKVRWSHVEPPHRSHLLTLRVSSCRTAASGTSPAAGPPWGPAASTAAGATPWAGRCGMPPFTTPPSPPPCAACWRRTHRPSPATTRCTHWWWPSRRS